ncbi:nuclear transport factor 2 family protein [Flavobacterium beibuense]|uniref:Bile-acid 7-alpha dehydratase n=1 Tax=Flavobacterium beibuense TaxID=657326 RepID=A0A444WEM6_9FLAO|nr:nuclear transport factor 2 family protein [Flavobacterium beibuense]RYJ44232.1 Bile-acid 7-alpha dehydratase [Flavobacterium beibuense]
MSIINGHTDTLAKIQSVMSAYCRLLDLQQWDKWRTLMADHATFEFENTEGERIAFFENPSEFIRVCIEHLKDTVTVHHLHNQEIMEINSDTAEMIWAMEDRLYFAKNDTRDASYFHGYGHYHISFVREGEHWLIAKLGLTRVRMEQE